MLTTPEKQIISLLREARQGKNSAYDAIIFGSNEASHREMISELQWQIMNGPGEDLAKAYGEDAVIKITKLKLA